MISPETISPGGFGMRRLIESEVTDLPEPDSPTIPNTSPCKYQMKHHLQL